MDGIRRIIAFILEIRRKLKKKRFYCLKISFMVHVLLYLVKVLHFRQNGPVIERQMCMSYGRLSKKGEPSQSENEGNLLNPTSLSFLLTKYAQFPLYYFGMARGLWLALSTRCMNPLGK